MSQFNDREKAYESKFARDQELRFKAKARRNKLLGLWAADLMGLTGEDADVYAKQVIKSDFEEPGDEDVFRKVSADLADHNVDISEHRIRRAMEGLMEEAMQQVMSESKP